MNNIDKNLTRCLWSLLAIKEQMTDLLKEMKIQANYFKEVKYYQKVIYHLNLSRTLLMQFEKGFKLFFENNPYQTGYLIKIKNTYFQRSIFQYSMCFDYYMESVGIIEKISNASQRLFYSKITMIKKMFENYNNQIDLYLKNKQ